MTEVAGSCAIPTQSHICCKYAPEKTNPVKVNPDINIADNVFNNVLNNKNNYDISKINYLA